MGLRLPSSFGISIRLNGCARYTLQLSMQDRDLFLGVRVILLIRDAVHSRARFPPQAEKCRLPRVYRQKVRDREKLPLLVFLCHFGYSGKLWGHGARLLCIDHVSFTRFIGLFPPSLQWVPWPPPSPWPCGSPPSLVLWVRKTAPSPFRSISVSLDLAYLLIRRRRGALPSSWGIPLKACPGLGTPAARHNLALSVVRFLSSAALTSSTPPR